MSHNHNHSHHKPSNIGIAFLLNFSFSIIEIIGGILTNSTAILSDAVHDLGDSLALALSFFTERLSKKDATEKYPYGFKRLSLIGAIINILVLSVGTGYVISEAIISFQNPQEVDSIGMLWLAILGIAINGLAVLRMKGSQKILDKTVVMHLLEDLMGWVAVLVVSIVIYFTNWYILDPILSMFIALVIIRNIWINSKLVFSILMQSVPDESLYQELKEHMESIEGVKLVDNFKLWSLDGEEHVASITLSTQANADMQEIRLNAKTVFRNHSIKQTTVEVIG
jgi:cobalt-zinc-cadmium efflux system protein